MDTIDDEYIWQRRIHHGVRYQNCEAPFPESVEIGLEFNAALERKEKLDLCLLTNAVMMELCCFARTVTKSETYFLFEMLEFNFDLGLDTVNDKLWYNYVNRVQLRIKLMKEHIKSSPHRLTETFLLPHMSDIMGSRGSDQPQRWYPKRNKIVDISVLTSGSKKSQTSENPKTKSNGVARGAFTIKRPRGGKIKPGVPYKFCKELGVSLAVRPENAPKEKLDPSLITNGVMMELIDFSRVLCGSHTVMVNALVKQNFFHEMDGLQFRLELTKLTERKSSCSTAEARYALAKEPFRIHILTQEQNCRKRRNPDADCEEMERLTTSNKRRETLTHSDSDAKEMWQDSDLSYMCPVDFETEILSGTESGPEKMTEDCLSAETKDVKQEEEEVFVSPIQAQINGPGSGLFRPKNSTLKSVSDLFSEDKNDDISVKTPKQRLWMRRATRSKHILKSGKVNDLFAHCRDSGLDFNVGSGNKQNVDLQLFTNSVLLEVYKFASAMSKSFNSFLLDIFNNNFNFFHQDDPLQKKFFSYIRTKESVLHSHPDRHKMEFLCSPIQFPKVYMEGRQTGHNAETEQQIKSESTTSATSQQADMELYPFCAKIGLNLWSTEKRPASQKLDVIVLTTGVVLEILSFIRELCGNVCETVNDILEHNFDLDLQNRATKESQVIQRWYSIQKSIMKIPNKFKINRWLNMLVLVKSDLSLQRPIVSGLEDLDEEDLKPSREIEAWNGNVEQVKTVDSYRMCKEIGLDLNISSKSEAKTKLDLQVLTRGVLFEMHQYVEQNCKRYVPALYEILEYNFDLSSQSHRRVEFAWSIASQVITIAGKHSRKGDYLNKVVELPFEVSESDQIVCKEEPEDDFRELDLHENDVEFVRELNPVDIEVEVE